MKTSRIALSTALAVLAGLLLRLWLLSRWSSIAGDALIYGDIAKNLVLHGAYAFSDGDGLRHTLIRLPGYPLFLAACFRIFGMEHYAEITWVQLAADLATGLLIWRFAARCISPLAGQITLWLAMLCPFTAICVGTALAEPLSLLMLALALYAIGRFLDHPDWGWTLLFTAAISYGTLLRPDGALVAVALWPLFLLSRKQPWQRALRYAATSALLSVLPFAVWTWRNWQVFHVFEPLAPRYATDPQENPGPGYQRWVKTWCTDFEQTDYIYWHVPGDTMDITDLPRTAFDNETERRETIAALDAYNRTRSINKEDDANFARLADERIHAHPLRYHLWLPALRVANMWFRPRIEQFPLDTDWWEFGAHPGQSALAVLFAAINLGYIALAVAGIRKRPPLWQAMTAYCLLRTALLWTVEAPETRYTLECLPLLFILAGAAFRAKPVTTCSEEDR